MPNNNFDTSKNYSITVQQLHHSARLKWRVIHEICNERLDSLHSLHCSWRNRWYMWVVIVLHDKAYCCILNQPCKKLYCKFNPSDIKRIDECLHILGIKLTRRGSVQEISLITKAAKVCSNIVTCCSGSSSSGVLHTRQCRVPGINAKKTVYSMQWPKRRYHGDWNYGHWALTEIL